MKTYRKLIPLSVFISVIIACQNPTGKEEKSIALHEHRSNSSHPDSNAYLDSPFDTSEVLSAIHKHTKIENNISYYKAFVEDAYLWGVDFSVHDSANRLVKNNNVMFFGTNIDTIISMPGSNSTRYLEIFTTFQYDTIGEKTECHACGAVYGMAEVDKVNDKYKIVTAVAKFDEGGGYGRKASISMEKFGVNTYVLCFLGEFADQGDYIVIEDFHKIPEGTQIYSDTLHYDNEGDKGSTSPDYRKVEKKITHLHNSNSAYDYLEIICKTTRYNVSEQKMHTSVTKEYYKMNEQKNYYQISTK